MTAIQNPRPRVRTYIRKDMATKIEETRYGVKIETERSGVIALRLPKRETENPGPEYRDIVKKSLAAGTIVVHFLGDDVHEIECADGKKIVKVPESTRWA